MFAVTINLVALSLLFLYQNASLAAIPIGYLYFVDFSIIFAGARIW